ncbi:MAG: AbrB/MazE/SpoVT family DNA-binding domain-containing protein [Kiritimatiellia bacterium]
MDTAIVTSKGQVVIPAKIRRSLDIRQGTRLVFNQKEGTFEVRPITGAYIDSVRGMLRRNPGELPVTRELIDAHAEEVEAEEADIEKRGV